MYVLVVLYISIPNDEPIQSGLSNLQVVEKLICSVF